MERIQSALEKARGRRDGSQRSERRPVQPEAPAASGGVSQSWDELTEFDPDQKLLQKNRVVAFERGEMSTNIDLLRTKTLLIMRDNNWKRLAITSPNIACGKTTTCLNLAFSIARQAEQRVLLIEMDLRKPNLLKTLGVRDPSPQFSRVLEEREPAKDHLLRLRPNLAVGANRTSARMPSELLQSSGLRRALDDLEAIYQPTVMIFDMPPMQISDDMMGFADNVDCVLLMAAAGITSIDQMDVCERELSERTNMLGVVLNKCRYMDNDEGYYYYG